MKQLPGSVNVARPSIGDLTVAAVSQTSAMPPGQRHRLPIDGTFIVLARSNDEVLFLSSTQAYLTSPWSFVNWLREA